MRVQDLTGQKFGRLTVLYRAESRKGCTYWHCRCECGVEKDVPAGALKKGSTRSCGCLNREVQQHLRSVDLIGQRFGRLTVVGFAGFRNRTGVWNCKCDCGNTVEVRTGDLKSGNTKSCGCLREENRSKIRNDLTGMTFGRLTVERLASVPDKRGIYWHCKCSCGNEVDVWSANLVNGTTKSCGCLQKEAAAAANSDDLTGKQFGFLTALYKTKSHITSGGNSIAVWHCRCICGNETDVSAGNLVNGNTQSCGCLTRSRSETWVDEILHDLGVNYDKQVKYPNLKGVGDYPLSYDFGIFDDGKMLFLIECQGQQHYAPVEYFGGDVKFATQILHDGLKKEYADEVLQVPIIEIPYWIRTKEDIYAFLEPVLKEHSLLI